MCWDKCTRSIWIETSRYKTVIHSEFLSLYYCSNKTRTIAQQIGQNTFYIFKNIKMVLVLTLHILQSYPIKDLVDEPTGTALSEVHGVYGILKLVWNQTWPLFQQPHLGSTLKLCYLMFVLFSIGHGTFMWSVDLT